MYRNIRNFNVKTGKSSTINLNFKVVAGGFGIGVFSGLLGYYIANETSKHDSKFPLRQSQDLKSAKIRSTLPLSELRDPAYATETEFLKALEEIKLVVAPKNVSKATDDIAAHSDSAWQFRHANPGESPWAVVYPETIEQVAAIARICSQYRVPLTPYSGGTSLEGQFTPVYNGISLDLNRMNNIIQTHPEDMQITVQPGVTYDQVNEEADRYGLRFGPDPGPGAEIGGMVGTNASGTNSYSMGTMRSNVVGLLVVLADGTVVRTRRRPKKSSAGYSLSDLITGSEGTLGIVVEITLKLHAKPKIQRIGAMSFSSIRDVTSLVTAVLKSGYNLDAMELMDSEQMRLINKSGMTNRRWDEKNTLLVKFAGPTQEYVDQDIKKITELSKQYGCRELIFAKTDDEGQELWAARKNALFSVLHDAPEGHKTFGTDTAVPISKLSQFVDETQQEIKKRGLVGSILGHVGDGNFHVCLAYNPKTENQKVHDFADWTALRSIELQGTCTGEHGIGMGKRKLLLEELGVPAVDLMRQIKLALDPQLILNPGKIFSLQKHGDRGDEPPQPHD